MYARDNLRRKRRENQPAKENPSVMEFELLSAALLMMTLFNYTNSSRRHHFRGPRGLLQSRVKKSYQQQTDSQFVPQPRTRNFRFLKFVFQREATMKELMDHFHVKVMIDSIKMELDERTYVMYAVQQPRLDAVSLKPRRLMPEAREKNALSKIAQLENQLEKTEGDEKLLKAKLAYWETAHKQLKEELAHGMVTSAKNVLETYKRSPELFLKKWLRFWTVSRLVLLTLWM